MLKLIVWARRGSSLWRNLQIFQVDAGKGLGYKRMQCNHTSDYELRNVRKGRDHFFRVMRPSLQPDSSGCVPRIMAGFSSLTKSTFRHWSDG